MITKEEVDKARKRAIEMLAKAGIQITPGERERIEVTDYGLGNLERVGMQILVYVNTDRYCAKELVLLPRQTCPEHRHPPIGGGPGKEETFRCRWGEVYLYVPGPPTSRRAWLVAGDERNVTALHEVMLRPGDQHTIPPGTPHWFRAGPEGAIVSEFSSRSVDEKDVFTNPEIKRFAEVK